jgi:hypothetical protein
MEDGGAARDRNGISGMDGPGADGPCVEGFRKGLRELKSNLRINTIKGIILKFFKIFGVEDIILTT